MADQRIGEGEFGDGKSAISEVRSPQSQSPTATADLPRTPMKEGAGQADGYEDTVELSTENVKLADAGQGSKL